MSDDTGDEPDDRTEFQQRFFPKPKRRDVGIPKHPLGPLETVRASRHAQAALRNELGLLRDAPIGTRNHQLNGSAFNLAQLCAGGSLDKGSTWRELEAMAHSIGLTGTEIAATLRSAFGAGEQSPRVAAELAPFTTSGQVVARRAIEPAASQVDPFASDTQSTQSGASGDEEQPVIEPLSIEQRYPMVDFRALWDDTSEEEWIIEPLLPARRLVALFSAPKVGKSLLMLEIALALARGTDVLGQALDRPYRVLYLDFENDPRGDTIVRLKDMGAKPDELDRLRIASFPTIAHLDTRMGGFELMEIIEHYGSEVVVIDTVSRAVGGEENSNDTWLGFYRNTGLLLKQAEVACIRLDHTGKDETKGMRGGSAKYGDVDAVWAMTKLTETSFELECTAHRLPIPETKLLLHRETSPTLHHRVDTRSAGALYFAELDRIIAVLDGLNASAAISQRNAVLLLDEHGDKATRLNIEKAVTRRKRLALEEKPASLFTMKGDVE